LPIDAEHWLNRDKRVRIVYLVRLLHSIKLIHWIKYSSIYPMPPVGTTFLL
jgi:7,8-dihydro-6-hydroxymethylpterin-pyrophosphokinase